MAEWSRNESQAPVAPQDGNIKEQNESDYDRTNMTLNPNAMSCSTHDKQSVQIWGFIKTLWRPGSLRFCPL